MSAKQGQIDAQLPDSIRLLSPKAMERLATEIPIDRIISGIQTLLDTKLGDTPEEGKTDARRPDTRALEAGIKLWLSYVIGLPIQRQEIVQHKITSSADPAKLLANPATLDAIIRQLQGTEAGERLGVALTTRRANSGTKQGPDDDPSGGVAVPV